MCETCEKKGRGAYAPDHTDDDDIPSDSSLSDLDSSESESEAPAASGPDKNAGRRPLNLDERRTRRGVYAVVSKEEDQSDESDDEDGNIVPLAGATDIPSPGQIEMVAEGDANSDLTSLPSSRAPSNCNQAGPSRLGSSTSELTPISRSPSTLSSLSLTEAPSGTSSALKTKSYQSIISTRRQKAEAAARLSAPTSVTSPAENSASSQRRVTRASVSVTPSKSKGEQKEHSGSSTPTPRKSDNGKAKEDPKLKKDDADPRTLRPRPSTTALAPEASKEGSSKPEVPRGLDGKPLPICATCRSILPVISVDHKIVWGLGLEKESKKKREKQNCPR